MHEHFNSSSVPITLDLKRFKCDIYYVRNILHLMTSLKLYSKINIQFDEVGGLEEDWLSALEIFSHDKHPILHKFIKFKSEE